MTGATTRADRGDQTVRVLLGTERFSSRHSRSELTALMPGALQATVDVQWCPLARRLEPFEVRLIAVRRDVRHGAPPTMPDIEIMGADRIHEALTAADAVILTASHEPGRPPPHDELLPPRCASARRGPGGAS